MNCCENTHLQMNSIYTYVFNGLVRVRTCFFRWRTTTIRFPESICFVGIKTTASICVDIKPCLKLWGLFAFRDITHGACRPSAPRSVVARRGNGGTTVRGVFRGSSSISWLFFGFWDPNECFLLRVKDDLRRHGGSLQHLDVPCNE